MTTTDGGTNAAYGFNFQFVTTAEYFLRRLRENFERSRWLCTSNPHRWERSEHDDIVDFAIEEHEAIDTRTQVKASRKGRQLIPSDAKDVFEKLNDGEAPNIRLMTKSPMLPKLKEACQVVNEDGQVIEYAASEGDGDRPRQ